MAQVFTATNSLVLSASEGALRLEWNPQDWCQVLWENGGSTPLGCDTLGIVRTRLLNGLADPSAKPDSGTIDGNPVRWMISLNELHHSLYVAPLTEGLVIYVQDRNAKLKGKLVLSNFDCSQWRAALTALPAVA